MNAVVYFENVNEGPKSESTLTLEFIARQVGNGVLHCRGTVVDVGGEHGNADWIGGSIEWESAMARDRLMDDGSTGIRNMLDRIEETLLPGGFMVAEKSPVFGDSD
ncbi:MAG: hypothetical protein H6810_01820 [Phycisphaeraceae bacterium]|nr:MAG: hypothetical protein H6810_01820 [Phycisphaeraceae bacterium]